MIKNIFRLNSLLPKKSLNLINSKPKTIYISAIAAMVDKEEIRKKLTPLQYQVTQERGTERPFTGCYNKFYEAGTYVCIVCEQPLFSSETKYDSGCGWPAFNEVLDQGKVKLSKDTSGAERTFQKWFARFQSDNFNIKVEDEERPRQLNKFKDGELKTNSLEVTQAAITAIFSQYLKKTTRIKLHS